MYPTRLVRFALRMRRNEGVLLPRARQICFGLLLPCVPRIVMALSNSHAYMTQEHGHALDRYAGEQQFDCERIQSVRMAVRNPCKLKQPSQPRLPTPNDAVEFAAPTPKEMPFPYVRRLLDGVQDEIGSNNVHRLACLLHVQKKAVAIGSLHVFVHGRQSAAHLFSRKGQRRTQGDLRSLQLAGRILYNPLPFLGEAEERAEPFEFLEACAWPLRPLGAEAAGGGQIELVQQMKPSSDLPA